MESLAMRRWSILSNLHFQKVSTIAWERSLFQQTKTREGGSVANRTCDGNVQDIYRLTTNVSNGAQNIGEVNKTRFGEILL